MKLSLLVMTPGKQEGKTIEIKLPQFLVGRDAQCHLRPFGDDASSRANPLTAPSAPMVRPCLVSLETSTKNEVGS